MSVLLVLLNIDKRDRLTIVGEEMPTSRTLPSVQAGDGGSPKLP